MANLILPRKRVVQPQVAARIDTANPITSKIAIAALPLDIEFLNTVFNNRAGDGVSGYAVSNVGRALSYSGSPASIIAPDTDPRYDFNGEQTLYVICKPNNLTGGSAYGHIPFGSGNAASSGGQGCIAINNVVKYFLNGSYITTGSTTLTANKIYHLAVTRTGSAGNWVIKIYINGVVDASNTTTTNPAAQSGNPTAIGMFGASSDFGLGFRGDIYAAYAWHRGLSATEIKSLFGSPWQIFEPQKSVVYFDVGASGAYTLTSADGSFALTGQTAGLLANRTLASNAASYSLSGQIAALLAGRSITSEASSFTLAGQTAGLLADKLLTASAGSFTLNGQSATLTYVPNSAAYVLTATDGAFLFSGQAAQLITGRLLTSNAASFTLTGQDAALLTGRKLTSSEAAFALDGVATPLLAGRLLTASEASYSLTGQSATLIYTPVGAYILAANAATYSVSGQDALLLHNRILAGAEGSFTVTGINAGMFRGLKLSAGASAFLLSGQDITFTYTQGYTLTCATGSYALSGQDAALIADRILTLSAAGFTLTGKDATLRTGVAVPVAIGDPDWQIVIKAFDFRTVVEGDDHRVIIH